MLSGSDKAVAITNPQRLWLPAQSNDTLFTSSAMQCRLELTSIIVHQGIWTPSVSRIAASFGPSDYFACTESFIFHLCAHNSEYLSPIPMITEIYTLVNLSYSAVDFRKPFDSFEYVLLTQKFLFKKKTAVYASSRKMSHYASKHPLLFVICGWREQNSKRGIRLSYI